MKYIKRHYQQGIYIGDTPHNVAVTIVGETKKLPDGTIEIKFGAARCGFKDAFVKKVGMQIATERFEKNPCTERLFPGGHSYSLTLELFVDHIAQNGEYIRTHFKTN